MKALRSGYLQVIPDIGFLETIPPRCYMKITKSVLPPTWLSQQLALTLNHCVNFLRRQCQTLSEPSMVLGIVNELSVVIHKFMYQLVMIQGLPSPGVTNGESYMTLVTVVSALTRLLNES